MATVHIDAHLKKRREKIKPSIVGFRQGNHVEIRLSPQTIGKLQHAVRGNSLADYKAFANIINDQSERLLTIRGLMKFKPVAEKVP